MTDSLDSASIVFPPNTETRVVVVEEKKSQSKTKYYENQPTTHGLRDDIIEILTRTVELFDEDGTLRIAHFQNVWKSMKFGLVSLFISILIYMCLKSDITMIFQIFHGRQDYRELFEFTEDLFDRVKKYCKPEINLGTRSAAFYLIYALYFKQPLRPIVRIRVTSEEYENFVEWMKDLRTDRHWELVYCWSKLVADHAFMFVASTRHLGLEFSSKIHKPKGETEIQEPSYRELFLSPLINSMKITHTRYAIMKRALLSTYNTSSGSESDFKRPIESSLSNARSDRFIDTLNDLVGKVHKKPDAGGRPKSEIGLRRKRIIERSMGMHQEPKVDDDESTDVKDTTTDDDVTFGKRKKKKKLKTGAAKGKNTPKAVSRGSDEFEEMARSLKAVEEDPSLMLAFDTYGDAKKAKNTSRKRNTSGSKKRGRKPKLKSDSTEGKNVKKKVKRKRKATSYDVEEDNRQDGGLKVRFLKRPAPAAL